MAAVTTQPQVFTLGLRMLLKTGTLLTWHCSCEAHGHGGEGPHPQFLKGGTLRTEMTGTGVGVVVQHGKLPFGMPENHMGGPV